MNDEELPERIKATLTIELDFAKADRKRPNYTALHLRP